DLGQQVQQIQNIGHSCTPQLDNRIQQLQQIGLWSPYPGGNLPQTSQPWVFLSLNSTDRFGIEPIFTDAGIVSLNFCKTLEE
ncbi:4491_t:CDS:2, partial [Paraglomus brasilianum]